MQSEAAKLCKKTNFFRSRFDRKTEKITCNLLYNLDYDNCISFFLDKSKILFMKIMIDILNIETQKICMDWH